MQNNRHLSLFHLPVQKQHMKADRANILYVDNSQKNLLTFQKSIGPHYTVYHAHSTDEALQKLASIDIQVIIAHQQRPNTRVMRFLEKTCVKHPDAFNIMVDSPVDAETQIDPVEATFIYRRLIHPVNANEWHHTIKSIFELIALRDKNQQITNDLESAHQQLQHKTQELEREIENGIKNQQRFCGLLETAPDAMVIIDKIGNIVLINQQTEKTFGYQRQQLIGQPLDKLIPQQPGFQHADQLENLFTNLQWQTQKVTMELLGLHEDKQSFPIEISISPLVTIDGVVISIAIRDITERKNSEHQIRTLNEELEQRVKNRTEELVAAKNAADQANQTKSIFLANMSHEIRTPMNGVIGLIDILQQSSLTADQEHLLTTMRDSSISLLTIINDILDFSKIEAGKMNVEKIPTSVCDIIENVSTILACNAAKSKLLFRIFIDPNIPPCLISDPVKLRQIILNLGSNAIKFTQNVHDKQGEINIRAHLKNQHNDIAYLSFVIKDNGIGMSSTTVTNLFEPFTQAENSTTRRYGGTGLGLSISSRLTHLLSGTISVQSQENEGSTFTVTLPFSIPQQTQKNNADKNHTYKNNADKNDDYKHTNHGDNHDIDRLKKSRIAILVHNKDNREIITQYLRHWGADLNIVLTADNIISSKQAYDIIVLDHVNDLELVVSQNSTSTDKLSCRALLLKHKNGIDPDLTHIKYHVIQSNPIYPSALLKAITIPTPNPAKSSSLHDSNPNDNKPGATTPSSPIAPSVNEAETTGSLVLLVEDNVINQDIILRQLNMLGYAADVASGGEQALEFMQHKQYALLLTDCHMPGMDGFQLTETIRTEEQLSEQQSEQQSEKHIPILAITANAMTGYAERCINAGMDDYISKPVRLKELNEILNKWLPLTNIPVTTNTTTAQPDTDKLTTADPTDASPIDPNALTKLVGDNQQTHHSLLKKFLISAESTINDFHVAYDDQSLDTIKHLAHKLKSAARAVGADKLADLCLSLEQAGSSNAWEELNTLRPQLDETMGSVKTYIEKL